MPVVDLTPTAARTLFGMDVEIRLQVGEVLKTLEVAAPPWPGLALGNSGVFALHAGEWKILYQSDEGGLLVLSMVEIEPQRQRAETCLRLLHELRRRFEPAALRTFLRLHFDRDLIDTLPGEGASLQHLVDATAVELDRRGLIDERLFDAIARWTSPPVGLPVDPSLPEALVDKRYRLCFGSLVGDRVELNGVADGPVVLCFVPIDPP